MVHEARDARRVGMGFDRIPPCCRIIGPRLPCGPKDGSIKMARAKIGWESGAVPLLFHGWDTSKNKSLDCL